MEGSLVETFDITDRVLRTLFPETSEMSQTQLTTSHGRGFLEEDNNDAIMRPIFPMLACILYLWRWFNGWY